MFHLLNLLCFFFFSFLFGRNQRERMVLANVCGVVEFSLPVALLTVASTVHLIPAISLMRCSLKKFSYVLF